VVAGKTLVERAVEALHPHCGRIAVVSRPAIDLPPLPAQTVLDGPGPQSALNALATGLAAVDAERVLVLACDLPLAAPLISRLAAVSLRDPVVAADPGGRVQPLCGRYARSDALAACTGLLAQGELRLLPLLDRLGPSVLTASGDELTNVNGPPDLEAVEAVLARRQS
jgi:molybdopterin-guanine dinucleotide biosynthesis protein A